jgi:hypothetical protein
MKKLAMLIFATAFAGCASLPSREEAASADYGAFPNEYEQIVKSYYETRLKDPESVRYRSISHPKIFWLGSRFSGARYGYMVCATLNAKNSYGAYVGFKTDGLLIRDGAIIQVVEGADWFGRSVC